MVATFGFSFGDFVAGILLIRDLIDALNESQGASADFRNLMTELYSLENALIAIKNLNLNATTAVHEFNAARQAVGSSQRCIEGFVRKVSKYQSLSAGKTSFPLQDAVKKISWALCRESDVRHLRESLGMQTSAILLLLSTLQLKTTSAKDAQLTASLEQQTA